MTNLRGPDLVDGVYHPLSSGVSGDVWLPVDIEAE